MRKSPWLLNIVIVMKNSILSAIACCLCGVSVASANNLKDAISSGEIWQKDRKTVCSTDFVGLRYAPIDDYSVRLLPRLSINQQEGSVKRTLTLKSRLYIDSIEFGETLVRWDDKMLTKNMEAWIYNRGDNDEITPAQFRHLLVNTITILDKMTNTQEHVSELSGKGDEDHVGVTGLRHWYWQWEHGAMLLEASTSKASDGSIVPEFIRLKMGPDKESIATGDGDNIVDKGWLKQNVIHDRATHDVYIPHVQMVDQGQKGYCLPATVARVFAYYGMDAVDQHALAQLFEADPEDGTYLSMMIDGLAKISSKFNYSLVSLPSAGSNRANSDWLPIIRKYIDDGIPLMWSVEMGIVPEPGLPYGYGKGGGHMRLIIGYNNKSKEIIYSDSWGAGHEHKRMKVRDAARISWSLHAMLPKK